MTARTRSSPRTPRAKPQRESFWTRLRTGPLGRREVIGVAIALVPLAILPIVVDLGALGAGARDWFAQTFGLGLFVVVTLCALAGWAIATNAYDKPHFWRRAAGTLAFAYFAWGLLGMNHADWSLGGVSFREQTLGGDIGDGVVAGPLGALAWASAFLVGMALLAPGVTRSIAQNAPRSLKYTWDHRWPHRFLRGIWTVVRSHLFA